MTGSTDAGQVELARVVAAQRDDGSWGEQAAAPRRIVTTIFTARSLQEAGVADSSVRRALDFLVTHAVAHGGASIDGKPDSVLSCYTGMVARLLLRAGRTDEALPLVRWIVRYQPVAFGGTVYHRPMEPPWGEYLRHRYGGCMAGTTCLLGLVPTMSALLAARDAGLDVDTEPQVTAMRRLLTDRRVMFGRSGQVLPLAGRTKADPSGTRWLAAAFPLDYVVDLVELVQLAQDVGVPREAAAQSLELVDSWRLPGGGWAMVGSRRLPHAFHPERPDRRRASEVISARVAALGL